MGDLEDIAAANAEQKTRQYGHASAPYSAVHPTTVAMPVPPDPPGTVRAWMVHDQGRQFGPHTEQEIAVLLGVGTVSATAMVWREGSSRWIPVSALIPLPRAQSHLPQHRTSHPAADAIKIAVLVSAIGNLVVALIWLSTCVGAVLTVPMVILCVYEFRLYGAADDLQPLQLKLRAQNLGVFEIIVGLFNLVSLVCGIIVLINASKLRHGR